jgi:hypothetical protein
LGSNSIRRSLAAVMPQLRITSSWVPLEKACLRSSATTNGRVCSRLLCRIYTKVMEAFVAAPDGGTCASEGSDRGHLCGVHSASRGSELMVTTDSRTTPSIR